MSEFRFPHRIAALRSVLSQNSRPDTDDAVDGMIVSYLEHGKYLTGFTGSNALVIITKDHALFLTDGRYDLQSSTEVPGFDRVILPPASDLALAAAQKVAALGIKRAGFETTHLTYAAYNSLAKNMAEIAPAVQLIGRTNVVEFIKAIKDADEIAALRVAIDAADEAFTHLQQIVKPGMSELDVAWELESFLRRVKGATRLGFDSIIGSGPNSAMIHGRPTERILGSSGGSEFLLCDYGCEINGYNSDLTRTFVVNGEPTARQREIYDVVKAAQLAALEAIKPGVIGKDVDAAARNIITAAGFGNNFNHGLGHGLGRLVHDQYGVFNATSELVIREGMVVTVEPGIYLDGWGGVRIEDDVLVTATGYEVLTHSTKEMVIL